MLMPNIQYEFSKIQQKRRQKEQIARVKSILFIGIVIVIVVVYYQLFYAAPTNCQIPIA